MEPEIGIKGFTADAGDTFDSGFSIGGTLGYHVSPRFALTAHGDFAGHDINGDQNANLVFDSGGSLSLLAGARFYPIAADQSPLSIFFGGMVGRTAIGWDFTSFAIDTFGLPDSDAIGAWAFGAEGGLSVHLSSNISLGAGLRYIHNSYDSETTEGADFLDTKGDIIHGFGVLTIGL